MTHKVKLIGLLICLFPFLTSCWDVNEPNRMLYIYGLGIDYVDGKYNVYAQIIDFGNIAKSEQPNPQAVQTEIGHATGDSLDEAVFNLYRSTDIKIYWGHLTFIVYSENVLKENKANAVTDIFIRYHETRYKTWIYTTQESVKDVLLLTPIFNRSMSIFRLADPKNSFEQESSVEPIDLRKLLIRLNEPSHEVVIPNVKIVETWETEEKVDKATEMGSISVLSPQGLQGFFEEEEARGLRWMTKETERGEIIVKEDDGTLTIILSNPKLDIKPIVKGTDIKFDIDIKLTASVSSLESSISDKEVMDQAKKTVEKEVKDTFAAALEQNIDIYRLSEVLYRGDVRSWKAVQKDGKIPLSMNSIRKMKEEIDKVTSSRKANVETVR